MTEADDKNSQVNTDSTDDLKAAIAGLTQENEEAARKKKRPSLIIILLMVFFIILIGVGIYLMFFSKEAKEIDEGYERQDEEEDIADQYLDYLESLEDLQESKEAEAAKNTASAEPTSEGETEEAETETEEDISVSMDDFTGLIDEDSNYYSRDGVTFTPDYAQGYLAFVLDIPTAGIKRGVYSGTWDEINYNLDIWMVTEARPDYVLGETHMCIYGHNHTAQDLSFNNLPDVQIGDEFYIYADSGYYRYEVTDITAEWRSDIVTDYVDNFNIGSDKCYILTCGRDYILLDGQSTRYKDYVVEGTLAEHLSLKEYVKQRRAEKEAETEE